MTGAPVKTFQEEIRDRVIKAHIRGTIHQLTEAARQRTRHALLSGAPMSELITADFDVVWVCGPAPVGGSPGSGRLTVLKNLSESDITLMVEDIRLTEPDAAYRLAQATGRDWIATLKSTSDGAV